jgi:hypothetical protein
MMTPATADRVTTSGFALHVDSDAHPQPVFIGRAAPPIQLAGSLRVALPLPPPTAGGASSSRHSTGDGDKAPSKAVSLPLPTIARVSLIFAGTSSTHTAGGGNAQGTTAGPAPSSVVAAASSVPSLPWATEALGLDLRRSNDKPRSSAPDDAAAAVQLELQRPRRAFTSPSAGGGGASSSPTPQQPRPVSAEQSVEEDLVPVGGNDALQEGDIIVDVRRRLALARLTHVDPRSGIAFDLLHGSGVPLTVDAADEYDDAGGGDGGNDGEGGDDALDGDHAGGTLRRPVQPVHHRRRSSVHAETAVAASRASTAAAGSDGATSLMWAVRLARCITYTVAEEPTSHRQINATGATGLDATADTEASSEQPSQQQPLLALGRQPGRQGPPRIPLRRFLLTVTTTAGAAASCGTIACQPLRPAAPSSNVVEDTGGPTQRARFVTIAAADAHMLVPPFPSVNLLGETQLAHLLAAGGAAELPGDGLELSFAFCKLDSTEPLTDGEAAAAGCAGFTVDPSRDAGVNVRAVAGLLHYPGTLSDGAEWLIGRNVDDGSVAGGRGFSLADDLEVTAPSIAKLSPGVLALTLDGVPVARAEFRPASLRLAFAPCDRVATATLERIVRAVALHPLAMATMSEASVAGRSTAMPSRHLPSRLFSPVSPVAASASGDEAATTAAAPPASTLSADGGARFRQATGAFSPTEPLSSGPGGGAGGLKAKVVMRIEHRTSGLAWTRTAVIRLEEDDSM